MLEEDRMEGSLLLQSHTDSRAEMPREDRVGDCSLSVRFLPSVIEIRSYFTQKVDLPTVIMARGEKRREKHLSIFIKYIHLIYHR